MTQTFFRLLLPKFGGILVLIILQSGSSLLPSRNIRDKVGLDNSRSVLTFHVLYMNQKHYVREPAVQSIQSQERLNLKLSVQKSIFLSTILLNPLRTCAANRAPSDLGVDNTGLFALCPEDLTFSGCISSQDDRPACFIAPWEFDGPWLNMKRKLVAYLEAIPGLSIVSGGATVHSESEAVEENRYIRAQIEDDSKSVIDDLEFYFTPNDSIIQYRSIRRVGVDFLARENRDRLERMRIALGLQIIPVLRNRKSSLFFLESPIDTFGPPTVMFESSRNAQINFILHAAIAELDPIRSPVFSVSI